MLGRKTYTRDEVDQCKTAIADQLAAYAALVKAMGKPTNKKVDAARGSFEPLFFNNLLLALDRHFVHRIRAVAGKDGNPLNEVEVICDSLMSNNGVLEKSTVIKLDPDTSVTKLSFGDPIRLNADQFVRLSDAFFAELERKFL